MARKRTEAQLDFDFAKDGWAFCNKDMLDGKISMLQELAKALEPTDVRHQDLQNLIDYRVEKWGL